jgi:hypothetical protein
MSFDGVIVNRVKAALATPARASGLGLYGNDGTGGARHPLVFKQKTRLSVERASRSSRVTRLEPFDHPGEFGSIAARRPSEKILAQPAA